MLKQLEKRIMASILLINFFIPRIINASNIIVNSGSTTVDKTANGIDLVNIANPNKEGISHNDFDRYNVNERGVVINNSIETGRSKLAGLVNGNSNLKNSAQIIIAEVSGSEKSNIEGYTEIFGNEADFILANPNGIYINGAGFINTSRVTLTTGKVKEVEDGLSLRVENGRVEVGEKGVDLGNVNYFEIISRIAQLNGSIYGKDEVRLISGINEYNYESKEYRKIIGEKNEKLLVGIDTSELGGIYAGRIVLIGTEDGIGVNSNFELVADVSDVVVDSEGNIILKDIYATGDIIVKSSGSTNIARAISNSKISLDSTEEIQVINDLLGKKINIKSKEFLNKGNINGRKEVNINFEKGINEGDIIGRKKIDFSSKYLKNSGKIKSDGLINISVDKDFYNAGGLILSTGKKEDSISRIYILGQNINNLGKIIGMENIELVAKEKLENNRDVISKGKIELVANELVSNSGRVIGDTILIETNNGKIVNANEIKGSFLVTLSGPTIENENLLLSSRDLVIDGSFVNDGKVYQLNQTNRIVFKGGNLVNKREIVALGNIDASLTDSVTISDDTYEESGIIQKANIKSQENSIFLNNLNNKGLIEAHKDISIKSKDVVENEKGEIRSLTGKVEVNGSRLNNKGGRIESNSTVDINLTGDGIIDGNVRGNRLTRIQGNNLSINTELESEKVEVEGKEKIDVNRRISGKESVNIIGKNLDINNTIDSQRDMYINIVATIDNKNEGIIVGGNGLNQITTSTLNNYEKISGMNNMLLKVNRLNNFGQIVLGEELEVEGSNINNKPNAIIYAGKRMSIKNDGTLLNEKAKLISGGEMYIGGLTKDKSNQLSNKSGLIESGGDLTIKSDYIDNSFVYEINEIKYLKEKTNIDSNKINIVKLSMELGKGIKIDLYKEEGRMVSKRDTWFNPVKFKITSLNKDRVNKELGKIYRAKIREIKAKYPKENLVFVGEYITEINSSNGQNYKKEEKFIDSKFESETFNAEIKSQGNINLYTSKVENGGGLISSKNNINGSVNNFDNSEKMYGYKLKTRNLKLNSNHKDLYKNDKLTKVYLKKGYINQFGNISYNYFTRETDYTIKWLPVIKFYRQREKRSIIINTNNKNEEVVLGKGRVSAGRSINISVSGGVQNKNHLKVSNLKEKVISANQVRLEEVKKSREVNKGKRTPISQREFILFDTSVDNEMATVAIRDKKGPSYEYMVENNEEFTDWDKYHNSTYFLERNGFISKDDINSKNGINLKEGKNLKEETNLKDTINPNLLGDSYYETILVYNTIYKVVKEQYPFVNINDRVQLEKLFNNGLEASKDLRLNTGIELTKEQINNLKADIIWLVEKDINNQLILVPELYLSKNILEGLELRGNQIIAKKNLLIKAKRINNKGVIFKDYVEVKPKEINDITLKDVEVMKLVK